MLNFIICDKVNDTAEYLMVQFTLHTNVEALPRSPSQKPINQGQLNHYQGHPFILRIPQYKSIAINVFSVYYLEFSRVRQTDKIEAENHIHLIMIKSLTQPGKGCKKDNYIANIKWQLFWRFRIQRAQLDKRCFSGVLM